MQQNNSNTNNNPRIRSRNQISCDNSIYVYQGGIPVRHCVSTASKALQLLNMEQNLKSIHDVLHHLLYVNWNHPTVKSKLTSNFVNNNKNDDDDDENNTGKVNKATTAYVESLIMECCQLQQKMLKFLWLFPSAKRQKFTNPAVTSADLFECGDSARALARGLLQVMTAPLYNSSWSPQVFNIPQKIRDAANKFCQDVAQLFYDLLEVMREESCQQQYVFRNSTYKWMYEECNSPDDIWKRLLALKGERNNKKKQKIVREKVAQLRQLLNEDVDILVPSPTFVARPTFLHHFFSNCRLVNYEKAFANTPYQYCATDPVTGVKSRLDRHSFDAKIRGVFTIATICRFVDFTLVVNGATVESHKDRESAQFKSVMNKWGATLQKRRDRKHAQMTKMIEARVEKEAGNLKLISDVADSDPCFSLSQIKQAQSSQTNKPDQVMLARIENLPVCDLRYSTTPYHGYFQFNCNAWRRNGVKKDDLDTYLHVSWGFLPKLFGRVRLFFQDYPSLWLFPGDIRLMRLDPKNLSLSKKDILKAMKLANKFLLRFNLSTDDDHRIEPLDPLPCTAKSNNFNKIQEKFEILLETVQTAIDDLVEFYFKIHVKIFFFEKPDVHFVFRNLLWEQWTIFKIQFKFPQNFEKKKPLTLWFSILNQFDSSCAKKAAKQKQEFVHLSSPDAKQRIIDLLKVKKNQDPANYKRLTNRNHYYGSLQPEKFAIGLTAKVWFIRRLRRNKDPYNVNRNVDFLKWREEFIASQHEPILIPDPNGNNDDNNNNEDDEDANDELIVLPEQELDDEDYCELLILHDDEDEEQKKAEESMVFSQKESQSDAEEPDSDEELDEDAAI